MNLLHLLDDEKLSGDPGTPLAERGAVPTLQRSADQRTKGAPEFDDLTGTVFAGHLQPLRAVPCRSVSGSRGWIRWA